MENSELWRFIETGDAEGLKSYVESLERMFCPFPSSILPFMFFSDQFLFLYRSEFE